MGKKEMELNVVYAITNINNLKDQGFENLNK